MRSQTSCKLAYSIGELDICPPSRPSSSNVGAGSEAKTEIVQTLFPGRSIPELIEVKFEDKPVYRLLQRAGQLRLVQPFPRPGNRLISLLRCNWR